MVKLTCVGCLYLISMYYKRYELQWRVNLFFCGAILAGAWGGVRRALSIFCDSRADPT